MTKKDLKGYSIYRWAVDAGFSPKEAKILDNFYKFAETGKRPPEEEFNRWKEIGFIAKDKKDGKYKPALDEDMINGDGVSWILAGLAYEGIIKRETR